MAWSAVTVAKGAPARKETSEVQVMPEEGTSGSEREKEPTGRSQGPHPGFWFSQCGLATLVYYSFILRVVGDLVPAPLTLNQVFLSKAAFMPSRYSSVVECQPMYEEVTGSISV